MQISLSHYGELVEGMREERIDATHLLTVKDDQTYLRHDHAQQFARGGRGRVCWTLLYAAWRAALWTAISHRSQAAWALSRRGSGFSVRVVDGISTGAAASQALPGRPTPDRRVAYVRLCACLPCVPVWGVSVVWRKQRVSTLARLLRPPPAKPDLSLISDVSDSIK